MASGQLLELVDHLPLVINQHLEEKHLPLFIDELMHGLLLSHSVLNGRVGSIDDVTDIKFYFYSFASVSSSCSSSILHISLSLPTVYYPFCFMPFSHMRRFWFLALSYILRSFSFSLSLKICLLTIWNFVIVRHIERVVDEFPCVGGQLGFFFIWMDYRWLDWFWGGLLFCLAETPARNYRLWPS